MDPALAGVIGAAVGATAGVAGTLISVLSQVRSQRRATQQQRKADSYAAAIKHLFRAAVRRSEFTETGAVLSKQDQSDWFLDLADGLQSLTAVIAYAGKGYREELIDVVQLYGGAVWRLTSGKSKFWLVGEGNPYVRGEWFSAVTARYRDPEDIMKVLWRAAVAVQDIATLDLSGFESRDQAKGVVKTVLPRLSRKAPSAEQLSREERSPTEPSPTEPSPAGSTFAEPRSAEPGAG